MALNRNPPITKPAPFVHRERVGFVRLYLDDLDALLRFMRSHTSGLVVLGAGKATADEAEDLRSATPAELRSVAILLSEPPMRVMLNQKDASVTTTEDSTAAIELSERVASLLKDHRHGAFRQWCRSFGWTLAALIVAGIMILSSIAQFQRGEGGGWSGIIVAAVYVPLGIFLSAVTWRSRSRQGRVTLLPVNREEDRARRTGWRVGIVTAVVGAIVGSTLTLLVQAIAGR